MIPSYKTLYLKKIYSNKLICSRVSPPQHRHLGPDNPVMGLPCALQVV